ncbi:MAG: hypothetical protein ACYC35_30170 [Pirellulales bacterium]
MDDNISPQQWERIDRHLAAKEVLRAVLLYREATGCGIAVAKAAIGVRFREHHRELWAGYDQGLDDEQERS